MHRILTLGLAAAMGLGAALVGAPQPAQAQFYGAEDGYNDDGIGWGPAYRRDTTFRPAIGFYGGVERPYPYGAPETTNPVVRNGVVYGGGLPPRPVVATTGSVGVRTVSYEGRPRFVARRVVRSRPVAFYGGPRVVTRRVVRARPVVGFARPVVVTRRVVRARPFASVAPRRVVRDRVVYAPARSFDGRPRIVTRDVTRY